MSFLSKLSTAQVTSIVNQFLPKPVKRFRDRKTAEQKLQDITRGVTRLKLVEALRTASIPPDIIALLPAAPKNPDLIEAEAKEKVQQEKASKKKAKQLRQELKHPSTKAAAVLAGIREMEPRDGDEGSVSTADIAKKLSTSTTAVCQAVEQLRKLGLVRLEDDSPDESTPFYYVSLTEEGRQLRLSGTAHAPNKPKPNGKAPLPSDKSGPRSMFSGKRLYRKVQTNPRREGTHGYTSFSIIKDGMTFEEYRKLGGRNNDLSWDIEHNYVEVK